MSQYKLSDNGWTDVSNIILFDNIVEQPFFNSNVSDGHMWVYPQNAEEAYKKIKKDLYWYRKKGLVEVGKPRKSSFNGKNVIEIIRK